MSSNQFEPTARGSVAPLHPGASVSVGHASIFQSPHPNETFDFLRTYFSQTGPVGCLDLNDFS